MKSPCCNVELKFRKKSRRRGELLLSCPECSGKWQCREGKYSHAYQVKSKSSFPTKSIHISGRLTKEQYEKLIREYGSVQVFLDCVVQ